MKRILTFAFSLFIFVLYTWAVDISKPRLEKLYDYDVWFGDDDPSVVVFEYDSQGRVIKMDAPESLTTFNYSDISTGIIFANVRSNYWGITTYYKILLDSKGFAKTAYANSVEWTNNTKPTFSLLFGYDKDGYLTSVDYISNDEHFNEKIIYDEGKITSVVENNDYIGATKFSYNGVKNSSGIMLLEHIFYIGLNNLEGLAISGFLGKAPTELPTGTSTVVDNFKESTELIWNINEEGLPLSVFFESFNTTRYSFEWSRASSFIKDEEIAHPEVEEVYNLQGQKLDSRTATGLVIVQYSDGTIKKEYRK